MLSMLFALVATYYIPFPPPFEAEHEARGPVGSYREGGKRTGLLPACTSLTVRAAVETISTYICVFNNIS